MDIMNAIRARRAVRDFTEQFVDKATLMELLNATVHAPSAVNYQPWAFSIVQDKAMLKRYSDQAKELMADSPQAKGYPTELRLMLADPGFNIFYNASTLVVISAKPQGQHPDWDCCFAAQTLMLAAHGMGLATCPIGFAWLLMDQPEIRKELRIPDELKPVLPIIVGYPAGQMPATSRKEPEILCWRGGTTK